MKKLAVFMVLFLAATVNAADWCATFSGYATEARSRLGVLSSNTTYVSDTIINQMIREAVIEHVNLLRAVKKIYTDTTVYNRFTYSLDSGLSGIISVRFISEDSLKSLTYMPRETWYQLNISPTDEAGGYASLPSYYDYSETKLFIYPRPSTHGDTIEIDGWRKIPSIAASDSLSVIPQKYRPAILSYVVYRVALSKQHPFVQLFFSEYQKSLAIAMGNKENAAADIK